MSFSQYTSLIAVGFLWGATNPLIKCGTSGIRNIQANNLVTKFLMEIKYLVTEWRYVLPFLLNQCGSVLYVYTLQGAELSMAVPIANSCAFIFTAIMSMLLGDKIPNKDTFLGILLITSGILTCIYSKNLADNWLWNGSDRKLNIWWKIKIPQAFLFT